MTRQTLLDSAFRLLNGVRKIAAGLRPFSESVWPGVRNDLFVAHESIYRFASTRVAGRAVLDAGCGTGYGTYLLARSGAGSAVGVDLDARNIAFASKRYPLPNLGFRVADLEKLEFPDASFGFVIASNSLEHLHSPKSFLASLRRMLEADGSAVIAVPPIYTEQDSEVHAGIHYHRSNLKVSEWAQLIETEGFRMAPFFHQARAGSAPDFRSHRPTKLSVDDFVFTPTTQEGLLAQPTITAVFLLERA